MISRRLVAAALTAAVVASACGGRTSQPPLRDGRSGLHGTGTIDGRQIVASGGLPQLLVGDCDPPDGRDDDLCVITNTIDGQTFVFTVENPAALVEGETLQVADPPCGSPQDCDEVTDVAIVSVKVGTDPAIRATGGTLQIDRLTPFLNYRGRFSLDLPDGRFAGTFDVVPRPG